MQEVESKVYAAPTRECYLVICECVSNGLEMHVDHLIGRFINPSYACSWHVHAELQDILP